MAIHANVQAGVVLVLERGDGGVEGSLNVHAVQTALELVAVIVAILLQLVLGVEIVHANLYDEM